jgi:DNA polymerase delta subunit 1
LAKVSDIVAWHPFCNFAVLSLFSNVPTCKGVLERGVSLGRFGHRTYLTYESNILFVMRFMVDTDMVGGNWITAPASKYLLRKTPTSHCQIEIDMLWNDIVSHAPEGQWSKLAPLRILSFDIECAGRKGHFPDAQHDPVIQIANHLTVQGDDSPRVRNILVLGSCAPIVGAEVHSFEDEKKLLEQWRDFVVAVDPDVITGYNIINFDLPYLLNRSEHLGVKKFGYLGRLMGSKSRMKDTVFSSKAYGTRESVETNIDGRVQFDVYQAVQRDHKLHSYSLNSVSAKFLGEQKEDVHHSIISDLHNGDSESRRRLAVYCLKDAYLPQRLLQKLMFMYNYVEMARVTGVPMSFLLSRGQQVKVLSQLLRKAKVRGMVIPNLPRQPAADEQYEGATVLEPRRGFYKEPIATLDFASLYPSIMMAYNLCYCTLLDKNSLRTGALQFDPNTMTRTPIGEVFMKSTVRTGLLPEILEELLAARKRAKADLKNATDPMQKAVLDGRQLALKISANSVYGFTGATVGMLPCLEISASVTAFGREMIEKTKNRVESHYSIANGFEHNAVVVYGDTDSVMVKFGSSDIHAVMKMGLEAAGIVTGEFIRPIKLEFEKVYWPYLLINKKRYAGLYWTNPDNYDKMDTKGIETVRRDNCSLVRDVIDTVLHKILIDRSVEQAVEFVKNTISDLLQNRLDISQLVITKALSRAAEDYDSKQAHVELAERMRKRDPATAPAIGDRVPYVMIKGAKGAKGFEKSEDPIYVLENNVPIDTQFYLEHQLSQPLLRIFEPIMENPQTLLSGDHTRTIAVATPSVGGLMKFAVKSLTCLGCKTPLSQGEISVCKHCKHRYVFCLAMLAENFTSSQGIRFVRQGGV